MCIHWPPTLDLMTHVPVTSARGDLVAPPSAAHIHAWQGKLTPCAPEMASYRLEQMSLAWHWQSYVNLCLKRQTGTLRISWKWCTKSVSIEYRRASNCVKLVPEKSRHTIHELIQWFELLRFVIMNEKEYNRRMKFIFGIYFGKW